MMVPPMVADDIIIVVLLTIMGLTAVAIARLRELFGVTMLTGIFTLTAAMIYVVMDAVDVAFTEAAVGAGISSILLLATLALTSRREKVHPRRPWGALVMVTITGLLLVYGTIDIAPYGDPSANPNNHIVPFYLSNSIVHTTVPNVVTSILASYRGFDTLGETVVVFTAAVGVLALLGGSQNVPVPPRVRLSVPLRQKMVLRVVTKFLIPWILLFALYVQFHGDFGPGGGFQAGVIFGSAFILYALIFGLASARAVAPAWLTRAILAIGVLIYGGTGLAGIVLGGAFLDYNVLADIPANGQHLGIFLVELGVGTTVAASMITMFFVLASQPGHEQREPGQPQHGPEQEL